MPLPSKDESLKKFTDKFMGDPEMVKKYPDSEQRYAVMMSYWKGKGKKVKKSVRLVLKVKGGLIK